MSVQGLPLFVTREIGGGIGDAGLLLALCAALEIPLMLGAGLLATRIPLRRLLIAGTGCAIAYMGIVATATSTWQLIAGQLLNAASIAALTGPGITYVQDLLPRHPGRASTLYSNTVPIGTLLAAPILGAAQTTGYRVPYLVGTALCAIAALLFLLQHPSKSRRKPSGARPKVRLRPRPSAEGLGTYAPSSGLDGHHAEG